MAPTHPIGVLHYTASESIILFCSANEMQWATHGAVKAIELHEEAIVIRATAPSATHIRAYMTAVGGEPPKTQSPPSEGEMEPHSPTGNPNPGGGTLHHLQVELGNLTDYKLHQPLEDLCWEVALCELNASYRSPPLMPWENPLVNGSPNQDGQEVTFLTGGGWVPPKTPRQPFQPQAPARPDGGWALQGPPPQPPTPAQPNADVGCLINTLTSGLHLGTPRINTFSYEAMPGKTEVSFEHWYHNIQCIKDHYPESVV